MLPATSHADNAHDVLVRLLEILAAGEKDVVAFLEAYFDESGTHDGSPILAVGGYVFEKDHCRALDLEWKEVLEKYSLPFFRMVDCAHGNRPFNKMSLEERIECEKEIIQILRRHMLFAVAVSVDEAAYEKKKHRTYVQNAYSWCCWMALMSVRAWIEQTSFDGEIAYFFEAGHKYQRDANRIMNEIFEIPELREAYRYASHSFVEKRKVRPIQAADMVVWHYATQYKRHHRGIIEPREDMKALLRGTDHRLNHFTPPDDEEIMETMAASRRKPGAPSGWFGGWRF